MAKSLISGKKGELIELMSRRGPIHGYAIHSGSNAIMSPSHWEKVRKNLIEFNLIEFKEEHPSTEVRGRKRKIYGLTFMGFIYTLKIGLITSKEAKEIRCLHKIKLPTYMPGFEGIILFVEENLSETFYDILYALDIKILSDEYFSLCVAVASMLALFLEVKMNPEYDGKYFNGNDIVRPDGTILLSDYRIWMNRLKDGYVDEYLLEKFKRLFHKRANIS